jgi:hypothetical protein
MIRLALALFLALVAGSCFAITSVFSDEPKEEEKPPAKKLADDHVILKAEFLEVDDAYYQKVVKSAKWRSLKEWEDEETETVKNPPKEENPEKGSSSGSADKPKLLLASKEISVNFGDDTVLLALTKPVKYLPSPESLKQDIKTPQVFREGVSLYAKAQMTPDHRFVRLSLVERSLEVEGTEKVKLVVGDREKEVTVEIVFLKEGSLSQTRQVPDGATMLVAVQSRPRDVRAKDHWLVARITARLYFEQEERERRAAPPK